MMKNALFDAFYHVVESSDSSTSYTTRVLR
jgi:hypothetical protein